MTVLYTVITLSLFQKEIGLCIVLQDQKEYVANVEEDTEAVEIESTGRTYFNHLNVVLSLLTSVGLLVLLLNNIWNCIDICLSWQNLKY